VDESERGRWGASGGLERIKKFQEGREGLKNSQRFSSVLFGGGKERLILGRGTKGKSTADGIQDTGGEKNTGKKGYRLSGDEKGRGYWVSTRVIRYRTVLLQSTQAASTRREGKKDLSLSREGQQLGSETEKETMSGGLRGNKRRV